MANRTSRAPGKITRPALVRSAAHQVRHVIAAGAVVTRPGGEVLLVHRPKYDDWSFPKGKVDPGEQVPATAVREVEEETGLRIRLGTPLGTQHYPIRVGTKEVRYWKGQVLGNDDVTGYTRGTEIDEVAWVALDKAERQLTYAYDRATLAEALTFPRRTHTLVVLRHTEATTRKEWRRTGHTDDTERPVTARGSAQAAVLVPMLGAWAPDRLVCSTSVRCRESVEPWRRTVHQHGDPVEEEFTAALSEEGATAQKISAVVAEALAFDGSTLLCTHRPVLGGVLTALGLPAPALPPGAALVVHHRKGELLASELVPAPAASAPVD